MIRADLTITADSKRFQALTDVVWALGARAIDVGIFKESGEEVVTRAIVNNYGAPARNIPQREFMASSMRLGADEINKTAKDVLEVVIKRKATPERGLMLLALKGQALMRRRIVELDKPPNAPSTIAKKGSDNPLIDTGEMLREVDFRIRRASS